MPNFRPVLFVVGVMLLALAVAMLAPASASQLGQHGLRSPFLMSAATTAFLGGACAIVGWERRASINVREAFLATAIGWIASAIAAALPLIASGELSFTDAVFEATSGLTTTGLTIFTRIDDLPVGILLWRSILQWIGGIGIIAMVITIMPFMRVGGMQLFRAESSERSARIVARPLQLSLHLVSIYLSLTVLCGFAYWFAGMSPFDAVNHAMTTVSTGGFSTHAASFGFWATPGVKWVAALFMTLGSLPFVVYIRAAKGDSLAPFRDQQVWGFLLLVVIASVLLLAWVWREGVPFGPALTQAVFTVTSMASTSGFSAADVPMAGAFAGVLALVLAIVGGCTGSTAGALKMFRLQIMFLVAHEQIRKLVLPNLLFSRTYNAEAVSGDVVRSVIAFVFAYFVALFVIAVGLSAFGGDLPTSFAAAVSAIGNVGTGLERIIGTGEGLATMPDGAKWLLSLGMLLGRLELFTVLILFTRTFWRA